MRRYRLPIGLAASALGLALLAPLAALPARADAGSASWAVVGTPSIAGISGGPWTLGQGPATGSKPSADYPSPNRGRQAFQPYYFPMTSGSDRSLDGWFDYRPHDLEEAIVAAHSDDGGLTWSFSGEALRYASSRKNKPAAGNDLGQGHPYLLTIGDDRLLYTFDRQIGIADEGGLLVHRLRRDDPALLAGLPSGEDPPTTRLQTRGLLNPDGIIGVVPGLAPTSVLYLQKQLGATPLADVTTVRLAQTVDGINFTDLGAVDGLTDSTTRFIGPRGTVVAYSQAEGIRYGLFFSGGTVGDGDSDAFHYVGYAESVDLLHWTVVNGSGNPLLSRDPSDMLGGPQTWYAGRVYDPCVTLSADGRSATLVFAGYHSVKPKDDPSSYRTIGVVSLVRTDPAPAADPVE